MESLSKKEVILLTAAIVVVGFIFLFLNLFYLPGIPVHLVGDKSSYLFNAKRMIDGQLVYRDFFQHSLPATEVFYFLFFGMFGVRAWIPNATLILLGLGLVWLITIISRKVIPGRAAFLPALLFLALSFHNQLGAAHDWFSVLMVMTAISLIIDHITALGLVGAGALCGVATCFSQPRGISAEIGLAAFLLWAVFKKVLTWQDCRKAQTYLWVPFIVIVTAFNAYFAVEAGVGRFLRDTVVFGFRYWPSAAWNSIHAYMTDVPRINPWYQVPAFIAWLALYLLVPLIYIVFFVRYWDEEKDLDSEPWDRLVMLCFVGVALFLGVVRAPTWLRLCTVSAPAVILCVWQFNFAGRFHRIRMGIVWTFALALVLGITLEGRMRWRGYVSTPIGKVAILNRRQYDEVNYLQGKTRPGQYLFGNNDLSYLLGLKDPARVAFVTGSSYTRPDQVADVIEGLKNHQVEYVFWSPALELPRRNLGSANHLGPLYAYLNSHYHVVKIFPNYNMFWQRGKAPPPLPPVQPTQPVQTAPAAPGPPKPPGGTPAPAP